MKKVRRYVHNDLLKCESVNELCIYAAMRKYITLARSKKGSKKHLSSVRKAHEKDAIEGHIMVICPVMAVS